MRAFLKGEARKHAGDPGRVVLRRLSNSEYTYTVRDLTGVESLDPTREFPVDGAAGEGFTNTGDALVMSPSLVTKYLNAAKEIASHAVLLPDRIEFSPKNTERDWSDDLVRNIQRFYFRTTTRGQPGTVTKQGIVLDANRGGTLPLADYLTVTIVERSALESGSLTIDEAARRHGVRAKYLRLLWQTLSTPVRPDAPSLVLAPLRAAWRGASQKDLGRLVSSIEAWQKALWKFNAVGHIGRENAPKVWQQPVVPIVDAHTIDVDLPNPAGEADVTVYLSTSDAGDGNEHDFVIWQNARLEGGGQPPLPLRYVQGLEKREREVRTQALASIAESLGALSEVDADLEGNARTRAIEEVASRRDLDAERLRLWSDYLDAGSGGVVTVEGHYTQTMVSSNYDFVSGWGSNDTPSLAANSSDREVRIPGIARPRSVVGHPSPTLFTAAGWQSPIDGEVIVSGRLSDAHPECGNGVEWLVHHRSRSGLETLWSGDFGTAGKAAMPEKAIVVRRGDVVAFVIGPRGGNHACDLTEFNLVITESNGDKRTWDLAADVHTDIRAANPHADSHGNSEVWHFYKGEMAKARELPERAFAVPDGSLLAGWKSATNEDEKRALADRIETLALGAKPADMGAPDAELYRQLRALAAPLSREELLNGVEADDRFGKHPLGATVRPSDLVVRAPEAVAIRIPGRLARGRKLVVTAAVDPVHGKQAVVQTRVTTAPAKPTGLDASTPILVAKDSPKRAQVEASLDAFRALFPSSLCYTRVVPVDEVVTLTLYYREDDFLKQLLLTDDEIAEIDRLWDELFFVSQEPFKLVVSHEQISEFATQDRPDLVVAFSPLKKRLAERAEAFSATPREDRAGARRGRHRIGRARLATLAERRRTSRAPHLVSRIADKRANP